MAMSASIQGSMPWRACSQCIRRQHNYSASLRSSNRFLSTSSTLRSGPGAAPRNPLRSSTTDGSRTREQEFTRHRRSVILSAAGMAVCAVAMYGMIKLDLFGAPARESSTEMNNSGSMKLDGPSGFPSSTSIVQMQDQDGVEQVPTGTSSVPHFPHMIKLPKSLDESVSSLKPGEKLPISPLAEEQYQLVGLGIRTVSFLSIQVYVVGLYVAKSDISELHQRLLRTAVHPPGQSKGELLAGAESATSLVPVEREQLKKVLLDPEHGEKAWNTILKQDGMRTVWRIVPTRNTDFLHLRDGWVRGLTARAQNAIAKAKESGGSSEFQDESFGSAVNDLKAVFGGGQRKSMSKGESLMLARSAHGALDALYQPDATKSPRWLGRVSDERVSRLVWLNYLAGKTVSSEGARQNVVDGCMKIVERPVGTVAQKVI